jgi:demethylmenaquinone methyltransferase/2-methoxy-6-polyprenyl-1,4-benzoquinol methylase
MKKGVRKIYTEVVHTYEIINHIMTVGFDIYWRKKAAKKASEAGGTLWLDVCSGTGEMVQSLSRYADSNVKIISVDFSFPMLSKAVQKRRAKNIAFVESEARCLPFADDTFDLLTISFATRNIDHKRDFLISHLREFLRVLKPGGRFVNLETSQPSSPLMRKFFHFYIRRIIRPVGTLISGSKAGYSYLSFTVPRFYSPEEFSSLLREAGFRKIDSQKLLFGVSAIHTAVK